MTLRIVTPSSGARQLQISYLQGSGQFNNRQTDLVTAGMVLDVIPGSPLETAIGTSNLTALTGALLTDAQTGGDGSATANAY